MMVIWCMVILKKAKQDRYFNYTHLTLISVFSLILFIISHYPILKKNEQIFGVKILSTQFGFELLQGFNPTAKGSWMANWYKRDSPLYQYAKQNIKNLEALNEYEESLARRDLAIKWIVNNPKNAIKLLLRKLAIYFIPENYALLPFSKTYNPINAIVYLFFFAFVVLLLLNKISFSYNNLIILLPILGSIIISLVFFVGYRWRIYAEPFMVLGASIALINLLPVRLKKFTTTNKKRE